MLRIGIDFDHVLFDTEEFKEKLFNEIDRFDETYNQAKDGHGFYKPAKHAEILGIPVEDIHAAIHRSSECLYPDVEKLEQLNRNHELVIVSRGDPHFQSEKIKKSGVLDYVDDFVIVTDGPKDQDIDIDVLIDDAKVELDRVSLPAEKVFLFDRSERSLDDVVNWLENLTTA